MNDQTDPQLLRAYAEHRSEPAFAELVRRHVDFVYSAARRMVCDSHLAEDVAQGVFLALAKNAPQLANHPVLSGWLHRTAQNIAAQTVRTDVRRRAREQEAAAMNELLAPEPDALWQHIAPLLDAALGELDEADRDALLLRYFERKSAREMAQTLGTSEDAAQKRVTRATERLREFFVKRGITVGAGGLVGVITANAIQAAPAGLAVTISTATALAGTTVATTTTTATVTKAIAMTALQKTIIGAVLIAAAVGAGIYEAHRASILRTQVQSFQEQQLRVNRQIRQLAADRDEAARQLAVLAAENAALKKNPNEVLKLRGEVGTLRSDVKDLSQVASDPFVKDALVWKTKEVKLRQLLAERPDQKIPELGLLDDRTFLDVARDANLDTEDGIRAALSRLRHIAENQLAGMLQPALQQWYYSQGNEGHAPQSVAQLAAYIYPPIDNSFFDRYEILDTEKKAVDADYDQRWLISPVGFSLQNFKASGQ